jgi:hypothetical protein
MVERKFITCLLVALVVRAIAVWFVFPGLEQSWRLRADADGYGQIAESVRQHRYGDVTRGPVYTMFVAVAGSTDAVRWLQVALDVLTGYLVYRLANRNVWALWAWALYPLAIWRVAFVNKEVVLAFLVAAYACAQAEAVREGGWGRWLVTGVFLGFVNLCKPVFLLWPVVLAVVLWRLRRPGWWREVALVVAGMVLLVGPWTIRNWWVTGGEFIPVATERGGLTTFVGNRQATDGEWEGAGKPKWQEAVSAIRLQHLGATEAELDAVFYRAAWQEVAANPVGALGLAARKCWRFWFVSAAHRALPVTVGVQLVWLALAGVGLWRSRPWLPVTWVGLALVAYVMVVHALSYADLRFSLPVMSLVCAWAGAGVAAVLGIDRHRDVTVSSPAAGATKPSL